MTGDVLLREVTEDDLPILFFQQLDPEATLMAAFPGRDYGEFMNHWAKILSDASGIKKTIITDGTVAGYILSFDMSGERQIGYWIGKEHWGRGIATRALELFLDQEPARPLHAHVVKHNVGSRRVLEKCGFTAVREEKGVVRGEEAEEVVFLLG